MADKEGLGGVNTYDKLSRGRKQEIDLKRRKELEEAKKESSRTRKGDLAYDAMTLLGRAAGAPAASATAADKVYKKVRLRRAQEQADYKDLKKKPTPVFRDKNTKGMSEDELADLGDFQVTNYKKGGMPKYKHGGSVRGDGVAKRGKTKGRMC